MSIVYASHLRTIVNFQTYKFFNHFDIKDLIFRKVN